MMSRLKELLIERIEQQEKEEALAGLSRWSSINDIAYLIVFEVKTTGASKTLDELYEKIKELYAQ
jgi:hypothetical protein